VHPVRFLSSPHLTRVAALGLLLSAFVCFTPIGRGSALAEAALVGSETGLPLPRFVSLKANKVNVRVGPSRSHPVLWVYQRKGMPVEVIAEFEHWRRVRDADGDIGWIFHSLLDGRRTALVESANADETMSLHAMPNHTSEVIAAAEGGVVVDVETCQIRWCLVSADGYAGWSSKDRLWGIYAEESFE
jgi:SH3-like domain-containing protein